MPDYWAKVTAGRIARRRFLAAASASAAGAAAFAAFGCDSSENAPTGATPGRQTAVAGAHDIVNPGSPPRAGGRLITANAAAFGTFDPHKGVAVASAYYPRMYNVLLNQSASKPDFIFLDLAESYEIPDDTTFIFKIRPGVGIAPNTLGVPERDMDAEDVRVTLERLRTDPATNNYAFAGKHIQDIRVEGSTVTVTTPEPYAWFLNRIGLFTNTIPPRELLADNPEQLLASAGAGGGPYVLQSVIEEQRAQFTRNPRYYRRDEDNGGAPLPYIDELEVRVVYDKATQLTAFRSGQTHQYMTGSSSEVRALGEYPVSRDPSFTYIAFTMNHERPPFDDPRVRRAISRAINRQQYVDLVYEGDAQANGIVQWSLGDYALPADELADELQPFDLEEAKRLVAEVGGIDFTVMYPANTPVLEHDQHLPIFLAQMSAAGITVREDGQDFATWVENIRKVDYQCTLNLNQIYETPEIPLAMHTAAGPFGDGTFLRGLGDPAIEEAVARTGQTFDFDERVERVHEAQRLIYEKDPVSLALVTPYMNLVWQHSVKNVPAGLGTTSYLLTTTWLDA